MSPSTARVCIAAVAAIGLWQLAAGSYIHAKAWLAQQLIAASWTSTIEDKRVARPWPWADTWPVAKLRVPSLKIEQYVLADASGRSLAFGPGHLSGSATPGTSGNTIIAAHRDTHFKFLKDLALGSELALTTRDDREHFYRIIETRVIDSRIDHLSAEAETSMLTLVTCYPFDAIVPGGPLRYIVIAERQSTSTNRDS
jgi:sortase A